MHRSQPEPPRRLGLEALALISERFGALSDPSRLQILHQLMDGEATVGEVVEQTGLGQANVSKHLQVLHRHRFVRRRKEGLFVHYSVADDSVFALCDLMCERIEDDLRRASVALRVDRD